MQPEQWDSAARLFERAHSLNPERRIEFLAAESPEIAKLTRALLESFDATRTFVPDRSPGAFLAGWERGLARGAEDTALSPGARIGRFAIRELLGAGGMGRVYLAADLALGRPTALKVLHQGSGESVVAQLGAEAAALGRLQHPGIASFYEAAVAAGQPYVAMEFVQGPTLRHRLRHDPPSVDEGLVMGAALLEALVHAHGAGVVHRDLKPENVIAPRDAQTKLLDFGVAVATRGVTGGVAGTPGYMSPEQLRDEPLDGRSDLFAWGTLMYELLSGSPAFPGTPDARIHATLEGRSLEFPPGPVLPEVWDVIRRALAFAPADRWASARACLVPLRQAARSAFRPAVPDTLAVLGFRAEDGIQELEWVGTGLSELLVAALGRLPGLFLVAPVRVAASLAEVGGRGPEAVGQALGCRWTLGGSYAREGEVVRLQATMAEVATGNIAFRESVTAAASELPAIAAARIAAACAGALDLEEASSGGSPRSIAAFEAYARGHHHCNRSARGGYADARRAFEHALELEPGYAEAWAGLGLVHALHFVMSADAADLRSAEVALDRALELSPALVPALTWKGYVLFRSGRTAEAAELLRRATVLGPESGDAAYFLGFTQHVVGPRDEGMRNAQRAVQLNPGSAFFCLSLGWQLTCTGRLEEARYILERVRRLNRGAGPGFYRAPGGEGYLAEALRRSGRLEEAREAAQEGLRGVEQSDHLYRETLRAYCLCTLGRIALARREPEDARAAFGQAESQLRHRPKAMGSGHLLVQALAGRARATRDTEPYREALGVLERPEPFNLGWIFGCQIDVSLMELARAALSLGLQDASTELERRARAALATEPLDDGTLGLCHRHTD